MRRRPLLLVTVLASLLLVGLVLVARPHGAAARPPLAGRALDATPATSRVPGHSRWLASWGAAPESASAANALSESGLDDQTIREIVLLSSAGAAVRVHLSNLDGDRRLIIGRASVAPAGRDGALAGLPRGLRFDGSPTVTLAPGAAVTSDPVRLGVVALERLAVSLYLPRETGPLTYHGASEQTAYLGGHDDTGATGHDWVGARAEDWVDLTGVDTLSPPRYLGAVVALGDSITAGYHSTLDSFGAWPDDLVRRLARRAPDRLSVIDEGISGNRLLNPSRCCGPSALSRLATEVHHQSGARDVILLEGTNDIGFSRATSPLTLPHTRVSAAQIIAADQRIISAAHAAGLRIFGATLPPFKGAYYWSPAGEAVRDEVNRWIRRDGAFDGVIDFASALAEPNHPDVMDPELDSGDHLHPDNAGYAAMARTIDLAMLER